MGHPLRGHRVVTTRDERGPLDGLLARAGADVVHIPLIEIADPPEPGALTAALDTLDDGDWVIVTSRHGGRRVGPLVADRPRLRLAAVGRATADELATGAGRRPEVVPDRQTAAALAAAVADPAAGRRVLVAQADRAEPTLVDTLRERGLAVEVVVAYVTRSREPSAAERATALTADAVAFASGSAAHAWVEAFGAATPPVVVAIGPSTARVAADVGLAVTHVAAVHSVEGLATEVAAALASRP